MLIIVGDFNAVLLNDSSTVLYSPSQATANKHLEIMDNFIREIHLLPINCRLPKPNYILYMFHGPNNRKQRLDYILVPKKWGSAIYDFTTGRPPTLRTTKYSLPGRDLSSPATKRSKRHLERIGRHYKTRKSAGK
jgi:hypothetical protein